MKIKRKIKLRRLSQIVTRKYEENKEGAKTEKIKSSSHEEIREK